MLVPMNLFPPGIEIIVQIGSDELATRLAPIVQDRVLDRVAQSSQGKGMRHNHVEIKYPLVHLSLPGDHIFMRLEGRAPAFKERDRCVYAAVDVLLYKSECLPRRIGFELCV